MKSLKNIIFVTTTLLILFINNQAFAMNNESVPCSTQECIKKIKKIKRFALNGSRESMALLGVFYLLGENLEYNPSKAASWLLKASKKQSPVAQYFLSEMYRNGIHFAKNDQNLEKAETLLQRSADNGFVLAIVDKGIDAFENEDYVRAHTLFSEGNLKFSVKATYLLAKMTELGLGTEIDKQKAYQLYSKAAAREYKDSYKHVNRLYEDLKETSDTFVSTFNSPNSGMETIEVIGGRFTIDTHLDFIISDIKKQGVYNGRSSFRIQGQACDRWSSTVCTVKKPVITGAAIVDVSL